MFVYLNIYKYLYVTQLINFRLFFFSLIFLYNRIMEISFSYLNGHQITDFFNKTVLKSI